MHTLITAVILLAGCLQSPHSQFPLHLPPAAPLGDGRDSVSVVIIGDVMMHSRQLEYDCRTFLAGIAPELRAADFAVANMEFSLGGRPYTGYPSFSAPDSYAAYVAGDCGVDVFLTANNHILDRGPAGLRRTLGEYSRLRDSLGTRFTGSARDSSELAVTSPLILFSRGIKIALVNFTYGTNHAGGRDWPRVEFMEKEHVAAAIQRARDSHADFIIALPHWGPEYSLSPSTRQKEWAEWLVAQGVDAIVGSHPHVVQDSTFIDGVPVIYSIGNAVSNMSAVNTRLGLMVELRFVSDRVSGKKELMAPVLHFTWCTLPGTLTGNYTTIKVKEWAGRRSEWLTPSDYDNMLATLKRVTSTCGYYSPL